MIWLAKCSAVQGLHVHPSIIPALFWQKDPFKGMLDNLVSNLWDYESCMYNFVEHSWWMVFQSFSSCCRRKILWVFLHSLSHLLLCAWLGQQVCVYICWSHLVLFAWLGQSSYVFDRLSHVMSFALLGQHGFVFNGLSLLGHSVWLGLNSFEKWDLSHSVFLAWLGQHSFVFYGLSHSLHSA